MRVIKKKKDEFAKMEVDQAVLELAERSKETSAVFQACTSWHEGTFPCCMKINLVLGAMLVGASAYMTTLFAADCFVPFAVTDTIERDLNGSALNVLLPMGWVALALFAAGSFCMLTFNMWASCLVRRLSQEEQQARLNRKAARITLHVHPEPAAPVTAIKKESVVKSNMKKSVV